MSISQEYSYSNSTGNANVKRTSDRDRLSGQKRADAANRYSPSPARREVVRQPAVRVSSAVAKAQGKAQARLRQARIKAKTAQANKCVPSKEESRAVAVWSGQGRVTAMSQDDLDVDGRREENELKRGGIASRPSYPAAAAPVPA